VLRMLDHPRVGGTSSGREFRWRRENENEIESLCVRETGKLQNIRIKNAEIFRDRKKETSRQEVERK